MTQEICVTNTSTLVSDADLATWCAAIQTQVNRDFSPAWGTPQVQIVTSAAPEANAYRVILKDEPDDPNDLGFHLLDNGVPEARIFCRATIADGDTISSVMSHEICEMLADPTCQRMFGQYIGESCDPVQSTGYMIGQTYVSNFVFLAYFDPASSGPWDFNHQLTGPVPSILSGSYIEWYDGQWEQKFARRADASIPYQMLKPNGRSAFRAAKGAPLS